MKFSIRHFPFPAFPMLILKWEMSETWKRRMENFILPFFSLLRKNAPSRPCGAEWHMPMSRILRQAVPHATQPEALALSSRKVNRLHISGREKRDLRCRKTSGACAPNRGIQARMAMSPEPQVRMRRIVPSAAKPREAPLESGERTEGASRRSAGQEGHQWHPVRNRQRPTLRVRPRQPQSPSGSPGAG